MFRTKTLTAWPFGPIQFALPSLVLWRKRAVEPAPDPDPALVCDELRRHGIDGHVLRDIGFS